jgi:hypothetical protein
MTITLTREEAQQVEQYIKPGALVSVDMQTTQLLVNALRARLAQPEPEPVAWIDAPERIYLQVCDVSDCDEPFCDHHDVSWCQDKINDSDVEYIRADTAPPQRKDIYEEGCTPADFRVLREANARMAQELFELRSKK